MALWYITLVVTDGELISLLNNHEMRVTFFNPWTHMHQRIYTRWPTMCPMNIFDRIYTIESCNKVCLFFFTYFSVHRSFQGMLVIVHHNLFCLSFFCPHGLIPSITVWLRSKRLIRTLWGGNLSTPWQNTPKIKCNV